MSQDRFQTSREVYHRIRWDPRFDAREFVIGYDAHGETLEEMPFGAFAPDGEIPWHRVWYFKRGHERVWDRRERIDRLSSLSFKSSEAPAPVSPPPPPPSTEDAPRFTPPFHLAVALARDADFGDGELPHQRPEGAHAGGGAHAASAQYGAQRVALDAPGAAR